MKRCLYFVIVIFLSGLFFQCEVPDPIDLELEYIKDVSKSTFNCILTMVEPATGLPHDRFDASLYDIVPQMAFVRAIPKVMMDENGFLEVERTKKYDNVHSGNYALKLSYTMPPGTWGSYSIDSYGFDASKGVYLQFWTKGLSGFEKFEIVLWDEIKGSFPGRPETAIISVSKEWEQKRILLSDFNSYVDLAKLERLSIGFNDSMHSGGTLYIDDIRIVDESGNPITISLDEDTNVTNIGLYLASIIAGTHMGFMKEQEAIERISVTLNSIGQLQKWKGFPQTHNHIVSLTPAKGDRLVSTVDSGNFAAGLIVVKERFPQFQQEISLILDAMEWDWFFDFDRNLPTGGRYPDGTKANWHYNWLCADSRTAHLIGIGTEKFPPDSWNNLDRDIHPAKCINENDWFFEPGWNGGGLFMALLPQIFINEKGTELETSAKNFIQDQICYASSIGMPAWGNSATALPPYGAEYCGYNCVRTDIIVPHASMLAAQYVTTDELYNNLIKLESMGARIRGSNGKIVQDFGFCTSLNWTNNQPSTAFLILDQCMAFLSLTNKLTDGSIQKLFHQDEVVLRAMELIR